MPVVFTVVGLVFGWLVYLPIAGVFRKVPPAPVGTDASGDAAAPGAG